MSEDFFLWKKTVKQCGVGGCCAERALHYLCLLCFPAQGFNTISAVGAIANEITGTTIATNSALYWISFVVLILIAALISFRH